jgi:protein AroM
VTVLGVVTIGQSPRTDMFPELLQWLPPAVEVRQRGALDDLGTADLAGLAPSPGDETLTTRLRDGSSVVIGRAGVLPRVQAAVDVLEAEGADVVLLVCTGEFPPFRHSRPLLLAGPLLTAGLSALAGDSAAGVICPLAEQEQQTHEKFVQLKQKIKVASATPYQPGVAELEHAARSLAAEGVQLLVLDCMGYTQQHREAAAAASGLPVVLSRSVVARLTAELT